MNQQDYKLEVAAQNGKPHRLVCMQRMTDGQEFRDEVNINVASARERFVNRAARKFGGECEHFVWLDDQLIRMGDEADSKAEEAAVQQPTLQAPNQATQLVQLAEGIELFHDQDNEAFGRFAVNGHYEVAALRSKPFRTWLSRQFYLAQNKVPGSQALQDAIGALEGQAIHDGPVKSIFVRVGESEEKVYVDLCNAEWQVVEISRDGWQILDESPVIFRRAKAMLPLPVPVQGGSVAELRDFVNMTDDDWVLFLAWLVMALRPTGPYPVLCVQGEHGSGKSFACEIARGLVDPNSAALRSEPRESRDFMIASKNSWILAFDNISIVRPAQSDNLCRVATGAGLSIRTLYENDEETVFSAQRPIIVNGIEEVATRADLLDRCLLLNLLRIAENSRRAKQELDKEFAAAKPRILGALLTAVVTAIRNLPTTSFAQLPRMADFALWAAAAEPGLGLAPGRFKRAYQANRENANEAALESSPIGKTLLQFADQEEMWQGTATQLLNELETIAGEQLTRQKSWPKNSRVLSGTLKRLSPIVREYGIAVDFGHEGSGNRKHRVIVVTRISSDFCVPCDPSVPVDDELSPNGGRSGRWGRKIPCRFLFE